MLRREVNNSEVAQILSQIEQEYYAGKQGLEGLAACARHEIINARMENIDKLHQSLRTIVGDDAIGLIADCLETLEV